MRSILQWPKVQTYTDWELKVFKKRAKILSLKADKQLAYKDFTGYTQTIARISMLENQFGLPVNEYSNSNEPYQWQKLT